jgi:hypothetical protein
MQGNGGPLLGRGRWIDDVTGPPESYVHQAV